MERMERRLRRWNEWNGGCLVRLTIKEKCHCIYCIVISLNVMVPPEFSFLALYNPQKSNQSIPLSSMIFAVFVLLYTYASNYAASHMRKSIW